MSGLNSSEQQLFETESLLSSNSESQLSEANQTNKDESLLLRQTIYNRSNLIKQHLQNRQNQRSQLNNRVNSQQSVMGNQSVISINVDQSYFQQLVQDKKVSLADVGRVYEKTNYGKWVNKISTEEIYIDPEKKKKNSQVLKEQELDKLIHQRTVRSQSSVSEYYSRKLSVMNDQLRIMKEKILKEQIQNFNSQITAKGSANGLKEMSKQNQSKIQDYPEEILTRCNRVDSYFNYKKNHNFLPKRAATSFSFGTNKENKKSLSSQKGKTRETDGLKTTDSQNKSTIDGKSMMISQSQFLSEENSQQLRENNPSQLKQQTQPSIDYLPFHELQNSFQKSVSPSPIPFDENFAENRSIFSQLGNKENTSFMERAAKKVEQRSQSQKEKYLDADFSLSPIKENISSTASGKRTKLPFLKNERSLPEKNLLKGLNKGKIKTNNQYIIQQQKDNSLSPPPSIGLNNLPGSPSLRSIQDKKGNRLAQQIERKINRLKKGQRMSQIQLNDNNQFQFGQSLMVFQEFQEKPNTSFQSSVLNNGRFSLHAQSATNNNKHKLQRLQSIERHSFQDMQILHNNQLNMSQNLIKEEDEFDDNFMKTKNNNNNNNESKRGSVNLLQFSNSQEKMKPSSGSNNQKFLKSQGSILLQDDLNKVQSQPTQGDSSEKHNQIQLIRKDTQSKHKTSAPTEFSQPSIHYPQVNTSNSNSPQNRQRVNTEMSPTSPNRVNFQSYENKYLQSTLNVSDILNKSVQTRQRSTTNNNFNSPMQQHQTAQLLNEESHKLKEQLPDITGQLVKGIEEEYGKKDSIDVLYIFYSQLQQVIQIEINDLEQNIRFKWDRQLNERKKMLTQKLTVMKAMQNLILSCNQVDEEIKSGNKQIHSMKKKEIGMIKNIDFYYDILQQHDFPDEEIGKVILQMKQIEQIRDNANANQFVKDFRYNTVNNQMDSNMIVMQADRQDRAKRVKEFNQQRRISKIQKFS